MINNTQELITWVDIRDNKLGLRPRKDFYSGEYIHRTVGLLLFNSKGELLICRRSRKKIHEPGVYCHSVDGAVGVESSRESILREFEEELGIQGTVTSFYKYYYENIGVNKLWKLVYICVSDLPIVPNNEIEDVKRITLDDLFLDIMVHPDEYAGSFIQSMQFLKQKISSEKSCITQETESQPVM